MYCSVADVEGKLGFAAGTYHAGTTPTLAQVTDEIANITAEIDMTLESIGIDLPLTDVTILAVVKQKCIFGSAGSIRMSYYDSDSENLTDKQGDYFYKIYSDFLKDIKANPALIGVSAGEDVIVTGNNYTDGTTTATEQNLIADGEFSY